MYLGANDEPNRTHSAQVPLYCLLWKTRSKLWRIHDPLTADGKLSLVGEQEKSTADSFANFKIRGPHDNLATVKASVREYL
jgi:hypothetical protein